MPYKSEAQRKYFHANSKELAKQGVDVKEWDKESKGLKLPKKIKKRRSNIIVKIPKEPGKFH